MRVLICTITAGQGADFLRELLDARLVACGNIVAGVRSLYRWRGEICDEPEELLVMETAAEGIDATIAAVRQRHPYEVPKILALSPDEVLPAYLDWVRDQVG